ncbi:MAG TPA: ATP-binding protein [Actinomycetes bacterium]|nr:ATP-binding protein [Actinomycetes bacterium]
MLPGSPSLEAVLADDPAEVGRARGLSTQFLLELGSRAPDVAVLLVSELVTNAIRHGRPPILLRAYRQGPGLRVEVSDAERHSPVTARTAAGDVPDGGRGLLLVEGLSDRWGWSSTGLGKMVWFELDVI